MEYLSEYFEFCQYVFGASAVYRLVKPIPLQVLNTDLGAMPLDRKLELYNRALEKAEPSVQQVMKCGLARCYADNGMIEAAHKALDSVILGVRHKDAERDFSTIAESNLRIMRELLVT